MSNFAVRWYVAAALAVAVSATNCEAADSSPGTGVDSLATELQVGDVVFIRVSALPFRKVASATGSWTNHVGIVTDVSGPQPIVSESTFPFSRATTLSRFVGRSEKGRVAVYRLAGGLSDSERTRVVSAARSRYGIFYDTGFNLNSSREFCSRYVREVLYEATGVQVGEVETFSTLLARNPNESLAFWRIWYGGRIPWSRNTVTPASLLNSTLLTPMFDGNAVS